MDNNRHLRHLPLSLSVAAATSAASLAFPWEQQEEEMSGAAAELKRALLQATVELETTRAAAQAELRRLEEQALHLTHLLDVATRERDEARGHCHILLRLLLDRALPPKPAPGSDHIQPLAAADGMSNGAVSEEEEGSNGTSPANPPPSAAMAAVEAAAARRGLPEKGRLVEAVVGAGPLLQTLLVAGPLPRWRHPPPALQTFEIPPVSIGLNTNTNPKREEEGEGDDFVTGFFPRSVSPPLRQPNSAGP